MMTPIFAKGLDLLEPNTSLNGIHFGIFFLKFLRCTILKCDIHRTLGSVGKLHQTKLALDTFRHENVHTFLSKSIVHTEKQFNIEFTLVKLINT